MLSPMGTILRAHEMHLWDVSFHEGLVASSCQAGHVALWQLEPPCTARACRRICTSIPLCSDIGDAPAAFVRLGGHGMLPA